MKAKVFGTLQSKCTSCFQCDDSSSISLGGLTDATPFSADCTNVPYGRMFQCEGAVNLTRSFFETNNTSPSPDLNLVGRLPYREDLAGKPVWWEHSNLVTFPSPQKYFFVQTSGFHPLQSLDLQTAKSFVMWSDWESNTTCTAGIQKGNESDWIQCQSCKKCAFNTRDAYKVTFAADYSNIEGGRVMACELAFGFFPWSENSIDLNANIMDDGTQEHDETNKQQKILRTTSYAISSISVVGSFNICFMMTMLSVLLF